MQYNYTMLQFGLFQGEIEYDNVEDVSPLSSEYEDNADLIPEHKTERPWTVSNNEVCPANSYSLNNEL